MELTTVTELAVRTVAESYPGWSEPDQYDNNREWLIKRHSHIPYTDDEFERTLAHMNSRLDAVNAQCIDQARAHVQALLDAGFVITLPEN